MAFVSFIVIIAVILAFTEDKWKLKNGLSLSFWLVVIVFSLRYNYGNDFKTYEEWFNNIISYSSFGQALEKRPDIEIGWVALNYLFKPFGFQFVIAFTTFIVCCVYYFLIRRYVPKPYKWVGVLIFLMYPNLFVLNLSMIRQGLAGALFFLSFFKGYENKWIQSLMLIILAISVHQIAIICIPFVLMINLKNFLNPIYLVLVVVGVFIVCLFNPLIIENLFAQIMSTDFAYESYSNYMSKDGLEDIRLALFARTLVIIPSLFWYKWLNETDKYITIMFCIAPFTILFSTQTVLLLRLECFFLPFSVLLFSRLLKTDCVFEKFPKNWYLARSIMVTASLCWMFFTVRSFFHFFSEPTYAKDFANFHTIFLNLF